MLRARIGRYIEHLPKARLQTSKKIPEILLRAAAGGVILACGLYFVFGLVAITASYQPGTAIQHDGPVTVQMLWQEVTKTPFEKVGRWVWLNSGCRAGIVTLGLWFLATFGVALALVGNPRFFVRSRRALLLASWIVALGTLFGGGGLYTFVFTLINAFVLGGLDGEWIIEFYPSLDAAGILYLAAALLLRWVWALSRGGRASTDSPGGQGGPGGISKPAMTLVSLGWRLESRRQPG